MTALALTTAVGMTALTASASAASLGPYLIEPENSGLFQQYTQCMDVTGGRGVHPNGTPVQEWNCWNGPNQQWYLTPRPDGSYYVQPRSEELPSGELQKCLDVRDKGTANRTRLQVWSCWGGLNQEWFLSNPKAKGSTDMVAANTIPIISTGRCADVLDKGNANGTPLQIWDCWGGANQTFYLMPTS